MTTERTYAVACDWYASNGQKVADPDRITVVAVSPHDAIQQAMHHAAHYPLYPLSTFGATNFRAVEYPPR